MKKRGKALLLKIKTAQLLEELSKGRRIDGRALDAFRSINVETGIIGRADGSAKVSLGGTLVLAGVKLEIGEPFTDTPNLGVLTTNAEFLPLASPSFEPGPPDENAIELARIVDRGIRKADMIDLEKLCIIPGKKVWLIWVDIYVLNHDGNLVDAAALAAVAALLNTKVPKVEVIGESIKVLYEEKEPLPIKGIPVTVTTVKVGNYLLVDPGLAEEEAMEAKLTVVVINGQVCALQKGGEGFLTYEEVTEAIKIAIRKAEELKEQLVKVVR
ncbi:MAG: exosome complex protein Rrp42 [Candidatus Nezhaarchaeales archaeon]